MEILSNVEAAGAAAEGIIFPAGRLLIADTLPADNAQKELLMAYIKNYEAKYNEPASTFGGHAYDAFTVLMAAIEVAGNDRDKVRSAIENPEELSWNRWHFYLLRRRSQWS